MPPVVIDWGSHGNAPVIPAFSDRRLTYGPGVMLRVTAGRAKGYERDDGKQRGSECKFHGYFTTAGRYGSTKSRIASTGTAAARWDGPE